MRVIENIELLKKLQPYLEDVETDYYILKENGHIKSLKEYDEYCYGVCDVTEIPMMGKVDLECNNCGGKLNAFDNFKKKCKCSTWHSGFFGIEWEDNIYNEEDFYKTLTLEEAIELISKKVDMKGRAYIENELSKYVYDLFSVLEILDLKKVEKILKYLIDNNLLGH